MERLVVDQSSLTVVSFLYWLKDIPLFWNCHKRHNMTTYSLTKNSCHNTSNMKSMESVVAVSPSWNQKTVLLVDDQIDVLITVKSMLQTCGYSVDAFNDPLLAVEHLSLRSNDYGIVISDMAMPFMSGIEFIKQVRAFNPEIVTFVITVSDSINDINKDMLYNSTLIELDGCIQKPISLDDLCRIVGSRSRGE